MAGISPDAELGDQLAVAAPRSGAGVAEARRIAGARSSFSRPLRGGEVVLCFCLQVAGELTTGALQHRHLDLNRAGWSVPWV